MPDKVITMPDGSTVSFPGEMSNDDINKALAGWKPQQQSSQTTAVHDALFPQADPDYPNLSSTATGFLDKHLSPEISQGIKEGLNDVMGSGGSLLHTLAHPIQFAQEQNAAMNAAASRVPTDLKTDKPRAISDVIDSLVPIFGPQDQAYLQEKNDQKKPNAANIRAFFNVLPLLYSPEEAADESGTLFNPANSDMARKQMIVDRLNEIKNRTVSARTARMLNRFVGLSLNDLPQYERMRPGTANEVGSTIYEDAGFKNNLPAQKVSIDNAINKRVAENEGIVRNANPTGKINLQDLIISHGTDLLDELASTPGASDTNINALGKFIDDQLNRFGKDVLPQEALSLRRSLRTQIKNWNPEKASLQDQFRQRLYHGLNDAIANQLDEDGRTQFRKNNRRVNRLIIGSDAAGEKLNRADLAPQHTLRNMAMNGIAGAVLFRDHPIEAAVAGAGLGALPDVIPHQYLDKLDMGTRNVAEHIYDRMKAASHPVTPANAVRLATFLNAPSLLNSNDSQADEETTPQE